MTRGGQTDHFRAEEISEMLNAAADEETKLIYYEDYAELLAADGITDGSA